MKFQTYCDTDCTYDEILAVSGAGVFTFDQADGFIYVCDEGTSYDGVLTIYDMTDPRGPILMSTTALPTDSRPRNPRIYGDLLFIPYLGNTATQTGLAIWDVSKRTDPQLLSFLSLTSETTPFSAVCVAVIGDVACVGMGYGFLMASSASFLKIDVSDPTNPSVVDTLQPHSPFISPCPMVWACRGFFVGATTLTSSSAVEIMTIDPSSFTLRDIVSSSPTAGIAGNSCLDSPQGNYLYVQVGDNGGFYPVDITDPDNIVRHTLVNAGAANNGLGGMVAVPELDRLYVGKGNGGGLQIYIYDMSTRSAPSYVGAINTSGETVSDMCRIKDGCPSLAWGQGTGAAIHLLGTPPLS